MLSAYICKLHDVTYFILRQNSFFKCVNPDSHLQDDFNLYIALDFSTVSFSLQIESLDINSIAAQRSFIWIWAGNAEGLERGRSVSEGLCLVWYAPSELTGQNQSVQKIMAVSLKLLVFPHIFTDSHNSLSNLCKARFQKKPEILKS